MTKRELGKLTYRQMADLVMGIAVEIKRRNPIFVNAYVPPIEQAAYLVEEISRGEARNFTSDHGPKEPRRVRR